MFFPTMLSKVKSSLLDLTNTPEKRRTLGLIVLVVYLIAAGVFWYVAAAQFLAVFSAPIPFILALLAVGAAMWGIVKWVYETQLRQAKLDIDWARLEIERFKLRRNDLMLENQTKEDKIAKLEKEKARLSEAGQKALAELAYSTGKTDQTLADLDETTDQLETNLDAGSASTGGLLELLGKDAGALARKEARKQRKEARKQRQIERQEARRAKRIGLDNTG
jgi:hypothetical protein